MQILPTTAKNVMHWFSAFVYLKYIYDINEIYLNLDF